MVIEERILHDVTVLDLKGKMTLGEGDEMLKEKVNSIIASGRRKLVLNLAAVPYIDSSGLGEIVRAFTLVSRQGGKMWLSYPTKRISDLLAITKLERVFEIADPEELIGALSDERLVAWCPICTPATLIPLRPGPEYQVCGKCGVQLKLSSWPEVPPDSEIKVDCAILRVATYDNEYVRVEISDFQTLSVENRLDLFASEVAEQIWRLLPSPRRVVFIVDQSRFTNAGLKPLLDRCAVSDDQERAAVVITGVTDETRDALPQHPAVHETLDSARATLRLSGDSLPRFRIRVRRE
jgi:anti-sigma B factor antagonist